MERMEMVTIKHPDGMTSEVPASAVRHWERAGWTTEQATASANTASTVATNPPPATPADDSERPRRRSKKTEEI